MNKKWIRLSACLVVILLLPQFFQNCSRSEYLKFASTADLSSYVTPEHPGEDPVPLPEQKLLLVNKVYVAALMRNIFSRQTDDAGLERLINTWIMSRPAQYGGACSSYSTYTNRDCGGDGANANLQLHTDDNTIRESFKIQFCKNILGTDDFVSSALNKIGLTAASVPSRASILAVYSLFYQEGEATQTTLGSLIALDVSLTEASEPLIERWRAQLLVVCESPGWQLL